MDYEKLKEVIAKKIKENGREEITGPVLQMVLMAMVDSLGEVYPQIYTDEQKAQARANIDALSDYDGAITKEKLSTEVQAILNDVANKQNITDESLATIAKTIVGAINEVYKGGLEDASIVGAKLADATVTSTKIAPRTIIGDNIQNKTIRTEQIADNAITTENIKENAVTSDKIKNESITGYKIPNETILERHLGYWAVTKNKIASGQVTLDKLASSVQNTLGKVGTNIKVLPAGTDLLSDNIEEGVHILLPTGSGTYPNFPYSMNLHPGATAILVKAGDSSIILGIDMSSSDELPLLLQRRNGGNWYGTSIFNKINSKLDNTSTLTDTEVNNIWDNN